MTESTGSSIATTSCLLLNRLAPETRLKIYGYVLTFDTPVKHAKNMQPFIEKITGSQVKSDVENTGGKAPKVATGTESSDGTQSLVHLNTSILSTNKLIYKEAIKVFYEQNVICFNALKLEYEDLVSPQATDLSLATRVTMRMNTFSNTLDKAYSVVQGAVALAHNVFPAIFSNLRPSTVFVHTSPVANLFGIADRLRRWSIFDAVTFEAVGSVAAHMKGFPELKFSLQCKEVIAHWNELHYRSDGFHFMGRSSARVFHDQWRNESLESEDREHAFELACELFNIMNMHVVPEKYPAITLGSHEFWTIVQEVSLEDDDELPELTEEDSS